MARTRSIKHSFFMNEELAELPCEARLLFIGLWTIADREGRLEDRPRKIKAGVFPYDECDVDALLRDLAGKGFVRRYEAKGGRYVQINNFVKHQRPHPKEAPSEIPVLDDAEHESSESHEKNGHRREEDGTSREQYGAGRERVGLGREKDGLGHEKDGPNREKDEPGREGVGPGREIPDSGWYRAAPELERNGPVQEKPGLPKNKRKEEGEEGKDKRNAECGMRNAEREVAGGMRSPECGMGSAEPGDEEMAGGLSDESEEEMAGALSDESEQEIAGALNESDLARLVSPSRVSASTRFASVCPPAPATPQAWSDPRSADGARQLDRETHPGAGHHSHPAVARIETENCQKEGVRIIFEYWREKMGHLDAKLTREREMKIRGRLGEGYTVDQLKSAVDGCRGSAFHQGDNDRGHRYDDITLICRSGSKLEQFIEMTKEVGDERSQSRKRSNVKKIMEGLELVRARIAQGGDPGDDNQQSEGGMLAAGARAG